MQSHVVMGAVLRYVEISSLKDPDWLSRPKLRKERGIRPAQLGCLAGSGRSLSFLPLFCFLFRFQTRFDLRVRSLQKQIQ